MTSSRLMSYLQSTRNEEDIEVEVSLDGRTNHYSVMVSDHSTNTVQSVMSIPSVDRGNRRRSRLVQNHYSQITGIMAPKVIEPDSINRRADLLRNLSPINNERSSPFDADHHRRRRASQSIESDLCRSGYGINSTCIDTYNVQDSRCRTGKCRQLSPSKINNYTEYLSPIISPSNFASKKPDHVLKTASKQILRSLTSSSRKVKIAPK